jgi:hypothetical protein
MVFPDSSRAALSGLVYKSFHSDAGRTSDDPESVVGVLIES